MRRVFEWDDVGRRIDGRCKPRRDATSELLLDGQVAKLIIGLKVGIGQPPKSIIERTFSRVADSSPSFNVLQ